MTRAHIHFGQRGVAGGISACFCSNLTTPAPPAGTQACPPSPATVTGTTKAADIVGPTAQGIGAAEQRRNPLDAHGRAVFYSACRGS